ncbi:hypothetical protein BRADI_2g60920v3 [Brachypodium distachyon]|uniref:Cytochrome P450 n=2 Tax=Brachypodium distachyon TaxID=15368 RepID=A0A0Q3REE1_BRADI|nr:hypothetical protein BRADI_2g60920v3 [Brachypodium distachyon]
MDANTALLLLLLFPVVVVYLRPRRAPAATSANHCPHPNPILGNAVPLLRNLHRFLDWATDLLAAAPASTIEVRGVLGLGAGVATACPDDVDHLLRANFPNYVKGARFAVPFADLLGHGGLFLADGRLWSLQRKLASYSFSSRSLRRFSARVLRAHLHARLLPFLDAAAAGAGSGEVVDLQDALRRFAFDNMCGVAFGVESSTLLDAGRRQEEFFAAFDDAVEISFARLLHPTTLLWRAMRLTGVGRERRMRQAVATVDEYVMAMIDQAEQPRQPRDELLLSRFAAAVDGEEPTELGEMFRSPEAKRRFLRDVVVSFVLAGKDTTSSALTWFFWLLAANPRCERRVYQEVATTMASSSTCCPGDEDEEHYDDYYYEELKGMHYLHAALTEAMRLYPPVPINSRVAAAADVLPDGTAVGAGWFADYSAYAMGRMPRLWGPRCREFLPERWLTGDGGEFVAADAVRYPVFHAGPRMCLGKEMAYVQMKAVAAAVVRRFKVETVPAAASMDAPPPYEMAVTLRMKGGLRVRIRRREDDDGDPI